MSDKPYEEMTMEELIIVAERETLANIASGIEIRALRERIRGIQNEKNRDYAAGNVAVGAIYRMVELIKITSVTHAQREGNFLLLLNFIDKVWPSHNGRYAGSDGDSDIPF